MALGQQEKRPWNSATCRLLIFFSWKNSLSKFYKSKLILQQIVGFLSGFLCVRFIGQEWCSKGLGTLHGKIK